MAIVLYDIDTAPGLYLTHELIFTHAWLPREKFDEVVERDGWVFARKGEGYMALWSREPYVWQNEGLDEDAEIIADGKTNVWICEMGRKALDGPFEAFMDRIADASVVTDGLSVSYRSPSQGRLEFSWSGDRLKESGVVNLGDSLGMGIRMPRSLFRAREFASSTTALARPRLAGPGEKRRQLPGRRLRDGKASVIPPALPLMGT